MKKVITCLCGSVIEGQSDDEVVKKAQDYAKAAHGMDLSRGALDGQASLT